MNKKGFTLIELLIVIVIVGLLTGIAIPTFSRILEKAKQDTFLTSINGAVATVVRDRQIYNDNKTEYTLEEVNNLMEKKIITSPFGNPYEEDSRIIINDDTGTYDICFDDGTYVYYAEGVSNVDTSDTSKFSKIDNLHASCGIIYSSEKLDASGANKPKLVEGLIPVYYDYNSGGYCTISGWDQFECAGMGGTWIKGTWKIADKYNVNNAYKWYDYDSLMWANAVTVSSSYSSLRTSDPGTIIPLDAINTMWVWIPRYKYTIFNDTNNIVNVEKIDISFETGISSTGTIKCSQLASINGDTSEVCSAITNNISTYTHPAFTFGNDELTGIWVGKFTNATASSCNSTGNCDTNTQSITIKPMETSLGYIYTNNIFASIRKMELGTNPYGFKSTATSYGETGELINDTNKIDTHLTKNSEWGAFTYLSQSNYGKYNNISYNDLDKEIFTNNTTSHITGCSAGSPNANDSSSCNYNYDTLLNGTGASTTGTIYGIYDTSGIPQQVMACSLTNEGLLPNNLGNKLTKYIDKYSYSVPSSETTLNLGEATKETKGWFDSTLIMSAYVGDLCYIRGTNSIFDLSTSEEINNYYNFTSRTTLIVLN